MNWQPTRVVTFTGLGEFLQIASTPDEIRVRWLKQGQWFLYWNALLPDYTTLKLSGKVLPLNTELPEDIYLLTLLHPEQHYLRHYKTWTTQDVESFPEILEMEPDLQL